MQDLEKVKKLLTEKQTELHSQLADLSARDPKEDAFRTSDNAPEDESDEIEIGANVDAVRTVLTKTLERVERALEKIDAGTYGICDMTGEQIDPARLEAIPWATYTLEAEEAMEEREGLEG